VALNMPDSFFLALVRVPMSENEVANSEQCQMRYVQSPFEREPDFAASSVNYNWRELWEKGWQPG